ncbi:MAG: glycine zipper 2TM domain-containing protein [Arenimonas sp.]
MNTQRISSLLVTAALAASLAACASNGNGYGNNRVVSSPAPYSSSNNCHDCGTVESVTVVQTTGTASGGGAVLGGIVGGVVGSQVGDGDGKKVATVAGVVGGAVAGNAIEKNMAKQGYEVSVRMDDGRRLTVTQGNIGSGLRAGSRVRLDDGHFELY